MPKYLIVGDGRMATHFNHYLIQRNLAVRQWSRRKGNEASLEVEALDLRDGDVVLLLIRDDAIVPFIEQRLWLTDDGRQLVHFSGSLVTPLATGCHPLMTFGEEPFDRATYEGITFVCEKGRARFNELFPELPNPHHEIDPELKPLYHSLCVMSGNFTVLLWQKMFNELETRLGVPRSAALPYLRQIARNLETDPARALTGPIQRKDFQSLARNQAALAGDPFQIVFESFVKAVLQ